MFFGVNMKACEMSMYALNRGIENIVSRSIHDDYVIN
jgi:hypothetical protein